MQFPENVKTFIHETPWIFAKTYAETWPHEYLCRHHLQDTDLPTGPWPSKRTANGIIPGERRNYQPLPGGG